MKLPKIIVCDLDGTFIPKHQNITKRGKKDLEILQNNGVLFGIASGRPLYEVTEETDKWGTHCDFVIYFNGANMYDCNKQKDYTYFQMSENQIKETFDIMKGFDVNPCMYLNGKSVVGKIDFMVEASRKYSGREVIIEEDWSKFYAQPNAKIMYRMVPSQMEEVEKHVNQLDLKGIKGGKTGPMLMEFGPEGCSKATALEDYCRQNNIELSDVAAFGDTTNDNEMLICAGLGVCLKNGSQDTKDIADVITDLPCDEDGWCDFVEKNYLIPNGLIKPEDIVIEEIKIDSKFQQLLDEVSKL